MKAMDKEPARQEAFFAVDYASFDQGQGLNWYEVDPNLQFLLEKYISEADHAWSQAKLRDFGALCGGPIAERAEIIDKNPPRLERYDRWGEEIHRVVHHPAALETKRSLWEAGYTYLRLHATAPSGRPVPEMVLAALDYLLSQADTGMVCATGMTAGVGYLIERYADESVKQRFLPHLKTPRYEEAMDGAMFMTEKTGGSDLSTTSTIARREGDQWFLTGAKWFCSNVDAALITTLARPQGAAPGLKTLSLFLVPKTRTDGRPNGLRIRRIKDKLGTRSVPTAEIDLEEAEAFLLGAPDFDPAGGRGINRMMEMVTLSRLGVAAMGAGIARRAFLEAVIYAARRTAFGRRLDQFPMVKETLVNMLVEVEAAAALFFAAALSGEDTRRQRILVPLAKFRATRVGLENATQALEMHGGNGYIENWPTARLLRDAQCHTIWEGAENVICLDVLRSMAKEQSHEALFRWAERSLEGAVSPLLSEVRQATRQAIGDVRRSLEFLAHAEPDMAPLHARRITQYLTEIAQATLLMEEATWELSTRQSARKAMVAAWFAERHFAQRPQRGITQKNSWVLEAFEPLTRYGTITPEEVGRWLA